MKIGVLSDTHGFLDDRIIEFLSDCDKIWHAGDIGSTELLEELGRVGPLIAVYGNIDDHSIRTNVPLEVRLRRENLDIWMVHIGGYPGNYDLKVRSRIKEDPPGIFISGHSHILKVMYDKDLGFLHINPGAAGNHGLHKVKTAVRFDLFQSEIRDLEIMELSRKTTL